MNRTSGECNVTDRGVIVGRAMPAPPVFGRLLCVAGAPSFQKSCLEVLDADATFFEPHASRQLAG